MPRNDSFKDNGLLIPIESSAQSKEIYHRGPLHIENLCQQRVLCELLNRNRVYDLGCLYQHPKSR